MKLNKYEIEGLECLTNNQISLFIEKSENEAYNFFVENFNNNPTEVNKKYEKKFVGK